MFDFKKINIRPPFSSGFELKPTQAEIAELEKYCGHSLPDDYKYILEHFNGGYPETNKFESLDIETGIPLEFEISKFFFLMPIKNLTTIYGGR